MEETPKENTTGSVCETEHDEENSDKVNDEQSDDYDEEHIDDDDDKHCDDDNKDDINSAKNSFVFTEVNS